MQGKIPKLNVDVNQHLYNSVNNTWSVKYNNDYAESRIKHFSFSERLNDYTLQNDDKINDLKETKDQSKSYKSFKSSNDRSKYNNEKDQHSSLLESKQDFKQSIQSVNNSNSRLKFGNDKSQALTIDHLGDSGRLTLKQNHSNKDQVIKHIKKDQEVNSLSNLQWKYNNESISNINLIKDTDKENKGLDH